MDSANLFLRMSTQAVHQSLEATRLAQDLLSPSLNLARYRDIVQTWATAWVGVESALAKSSPSEDLALLLPQPRTAFALEDLEFLDRHLPQGLAGKRRLSQQTGPLEPASSSSELLGVCYVAQGALLGGKVIARHVQATLQLPAACATRFFDPPGQAGLSWPAWTHELNQRVSTPAALAEALSGAKRTFDYLHQAFAEAAPVFSPDQTHERAT